MANLRKGSTVGGYPIVTEHDENDHFHHASDIDGLGDLAQVEDGPGSGFDADMLNGNHFSDMENVWLKKSGGTISSSVQITGNLTNAHDLSAVNRGYIQGFIEKNTITQSEAIPYVAVDANFTMTRSGNVITVQAGDILIGGYFYRYNDLSKNISAVPGILGNRTYYLYLRVLNDAILFEVDSSNEAYGFYRILVGEFDTDTAKNVSSLTTYPKPSNLGQIIIISDQPRPNSIINANNSITKLDEGWYSLRAGDAVDSVSLEGPTVLNGGSVTQYIITDYDMLSTYHVSSDLGSIQVSDETIAFSAPVVPIDTVATLTVTRNQTVVKFRVSILA